MKKEKDIIKVAKISALGAIIVSLISGVFLVISNSKVISFDKKEKSKGTNTLNDNTKIINKKSENFEIYNEIQNTEVMLSEELIKDLNYADDLYGLGQFASSYRHYEKIYNSLSDKMKRRVKQTDIEKAKEKYRTFKYSEAAYIMKTCLDTLYHNSNK